MFLWELKKLKFRLRLRRQPKKLARYARLGKFSHALAVRRAFNARRKDNSFCCQIWAECTPHPKVSSFNFFNFINFINSRNFNI